MAQPPVPTGADEKTTVWLALSLAWELGYLIALPAVFFGFGGAYLDKWLGTSPFLLLAGFAIATLLSCIAVGRRIRAVLGGPSASR